jgi:hypothetical protein
MTAIIIVMTTARTTIPTKASLRAFWSIVCMGM